MMNEFLTRNEEAMRVLWLRRGMDDARSTTKGFQAGVVEKLRYYHPGSTIIDAYKTGITKGLADLKQDRESYAA